MQWIWGSLVKFWEGALPRLTGSKDSASAAPYLAVFTCLMIGSAVTVGVAVADKEYGIFLGTSIGWLDLTVGLAIATVKASLVLAFFMHLNHEVSLVYRILILAAVFVFFMFFLCILALVDKPAHSAGFNTDTRDPYFWKLPEKAKGHGAHAEESHGEAHGADAGHHGAEADHNAQPTADAAAPISMEERPEEVPSTHVPAQPDPPATEASQLQSSPPPAPNP